MGSLICFLFVNIRMLEKGQRDLFHGFNSVALFF